MDDTQNAPSFSQAKRIKKLAQEGNFTSEAVVDIMGEEKKSELDTVTIKKRDPAEVFPTQLHSQTDGGEDHPAFGCVAAQTAAAE